MKLHFSLPEFDAQLMRTIGYTYYGGADIGECLATAAHIKEGDFDSWHREWMATAERLQFEGNLSFSRGHALSARSNFMRASNYFRTAMVFHYGKETEPLLKEAYEKHAASFSLALDLLDIKVERLSIPYEGRFLPAYLFLAGPKESNNEPPRPTIIVNSGYDSTRQESYLTIGAAAIQHGYHALCFDGPGQGEVLIEQQIAMRTDWERVITPVLDYALAHPRIDANNICVYGGSWGGYLVPRALCFDTRPKAMIANPGQFDAIMSFVKACPEALALLEKNDTAEIEQFLINALSEKMMATKFRTRMWIHRVDSPVELLKIWQQCKLAGLSERISSASFIADSESEPFSQGQARLLYDSLRCKKQYALFTNAEGAGAHCEAGASSLFHARAFDWLEEIFNS